MLEGEDSGLEGDTGGAGVGRRSAPGWPRFAVKLTVQPPFLVSNLREAFPAQAQMFRNSETAAVTRAMLVILTTLPWAADLLLPPTRLARRPLQPLKKCYQAV